MIERLTVTTSSEAETALLGERLADALHPGLTIALNGQLGAGKTNFVRATCGALGVDCQQVNSPTFVLLQIYEDGRFPVAHFDTYRLADFDEFIAIGGDEYLLDAETICFVEWAERVMEVLPQDHLRIEIIQVGETMRRFEFAGTGQISNHCLHDLRTALADGLEL